MRMHTIVSVFALLLVLDGTPMLAAEEGLEAHSKHAIQTITLDGNDVRPAQALAHADDVARARAGESLGHPEDDAPRPRLRLEP